jgi:hypothetical protein
MVVRKFTWNGMQIGFSRVNMLAWRLSAPPIKLIYSNEHRFKKATKLESPHAQLPQPTTSFLERFAEIADERRVASMLCP